MTKAEIYERAKLERKLIMTMKRDMVGDVSGVGTFQDKLREAQINLSSEREYLYAAIKQKVEAREDLLWYFQWREEACRSRMEAHEKDVRKWRYWIKNCRGENKDYGMNKEDAKQFPIGKLLQAPPIHKSHQREFYLCPLHKERTGSFVWYKTNNTWHCFGCGQGGDSIALLMERDQVSFTQAVKLLST